MIKVLFICHGRIFRARRKALKSAISCVSYLSFTNGLPIFLESQDLLLSKKYTMKNGVERDRYSSEYYIVYEIGGYIVYGRESKHRI